MDSGKILKIQDLDQFWQIPASFLHISALFLHFFGGAFLNLIHFWVASVCLGLTFLVWVCLRYLGFFTYTGSIITAKVLGYSNATGLSEG